jgi:diguanylate cyclase (GGDEF)-like protein/PAS domain S-box-containing protein
MNNWTTENWREIVSAAPEGIVICDATAPDHPVVYANAAFAQLCGYPVAALLGTNLRILQGTDRDQECRQRMRDALERGEACRVMIRNYRPDGSQFWNEMLMQPMREPPGGRIVHWVAFCRDASERLKSADRVAQGIPAWMREDRLTGLHSRAYFEELLRRDWQVAQRDSHEIGLTLFDIDDLTSYNAAFDKSAGDACIRRVARVITASYRRGSDFVGRWDGGTFAVLTQGDEAEKAKEYAGTVAQRVRELLIHHPRAGAGRFVSLSAGVASLVPPRELTLDAIIHACQTALKRAKSRGKNSVGAAEASDFEVKPDKK